MYAKKPVVMLASLVLVAGLLLVGTSLATTALAAARTSSIPHTASSHLVAETSCPPSCPNPINNCPPLLQQGGYTGTWVQVLDYRLNDVSVGGTPLTISSTFTAATTTAVKDYQRVFGLTQDGKVGDQTWTKLGFCVAVGTPDFSLSVGGQHCPAGLSEDPNKTLTWVNALQDLLNVQFWNAGGSADGDFSSTTPQAWTPYLTSDGVFGAQTKAAVQDFQTYELQSYTGGAVGNATWTNLGMCY